MIMRSAIYWFRTDLRISDNPALERALRESDRLCFVHCPHSGEFEPNGAETLKRESASVHVRTFRDQAVTALRADLRATGRDLLVFAEPAIYALPAFAESVGADHVYCEAVATREGLKQVEALRAAGLSISETWQSTLFRPAQLPFPIDALPATFTAFRKALEASGAVPDEPLPPCRIAADPMSKAYSAALSGVRSLRPYVPAAGIPERSPRSSFP